MHKCTHSNRKDFCYECVSDVRGYQGRIIEQLSNRLDYVWKNSDQITKELILNSEIRYPLTDTQVLASFPITDEASPDHYVEVVAEAVKTLKQLKKIHESARLKFFDSSFIIYADMTKKEDNYV